MTACSAGAMAHGKRTTACIFLMAKDFAVDGNVSGKNRPVPIGMILCVSETHLPTEMPWPMRIPGLTFWQYRRAGLS